MDQTFTQPCILTGFEGAQMISLRKIGGIYWLRIGRHRFAYCHIRDRRPL